MVTGELKEDLAFRQVKINYQRQEEVGGDNCEPDSQTKSTSTSYTILITPITGCDDNTALIAGLTTGAPLFPVPYLFVFKLLICFILSCLTKHLNHQRSRCGSCGAGGAGHHQCHCLGLVAGEEKSQHAL